MTPLTFYRQQAAKERDAADTAVLENVRDRSRRAAEAWTKLASQIEYADELRAERHAPVPTGGHLSEPSENPDRGRATSSLDAAGSTKLMAKCKGGNGDG